jgi:hypothetical protein
MKSGPRFAGASLRRIEQRYGTPIDYYQPFNEATNLTTGAQTVQYRSQTIRRALVLPFTITRGFLYDTAFLGAGNKDAKDFSFGAFYDKSESSVIVRLPQLKGIVPKMSDFFAWHALRFDVKDIATYPDIQLYVFTVSRTQSCKDLYVRNTSFVFLTQGDA